MLAKRKAEKQPQKEVDNFGRPVCNVCGKAHSWKHGVLNWCIFFDRINKQPIETQIKWTIGEANDIAPKFVQVKPVKAISPPQETLDFYEQDKARREAFKNADPAKNKILRENWRWLNEDILGVTRTDLPEWHPHRK